VFYSWECKKCDKVLKTQGGLFAHRYSVHSKYRFNCPLCPRISTSRQNCQKHLKLSHGFTPEQYKKVEITRFVQDEAIKDEEVMYDEDSDTENSRFDIESDLEDSAIIDENLEICKSDASIINPVTIPSQDLRGGVYMPSFIHK
jgi:hypothetical protein